MTNMCKFYLNNNYLIVISQKIKIIDRKFAICVIPRKTFKASAKLETSPELIGLYLKFKKKKKLARFCLNYCS